MKKIIVFSFVAFFALSNSLTVKAAPFIPGDVVAVLVGDGTAALNANATAAFLQEFNPTIVNQLSPIQTIALPTGASGLTLSGSATSEGFLTLSVNGQYLTMGGYAAVPGTAGVVAAAPGTVNRVVGRIDMSGNIDISTALNDPYNGSNIRSTVSTDGINIWTAGNGGSGQGATAGVRYTTFGSTTTTQVNPTTSNMRVVNIFNGQLYVSSSSGTLLGVSTVGTGEPTSSIGGAPTLLPGMPTTGTHSPYDFFFKDANTLYVADDGAVASGGGIQKWTFAASTWTLQYTLLNNGTTTTATRGLAGEIDGSGNAVLFGTSGSTLFTVTDTGAGSLATTLATAPLNTVFRGVEFLPVPEPSSLALAALGGLACLVASRRKH
jgi:hypothetical protein